MGTSKSAHFKIKWIESKINSVMQTGLIVDKEKLIAEFCIQLASTRKTCVEILNNLDYLGKIKIMNNEIWDTPNWEADQVLKRAQGNQKNPEGGNSQ